MRFITFFVTVETVVYYKSDCRRQCCLGPSDSISIMLVVGKIQRHLFQVSKPAFVSYSLVVDEPSNRLGLGDVHYVFYRLLPMIKSCIILRLKLVFLGDTATMYC